MIEVIAAVHTTGVNFEGACATAAAVVVILSPFGLLARYLLRGTLKNALHEAIEPLQEQLDRHEVDIATLKGFQDGQRSAVAQQTNAQHTPPHRG